MEDLDLFLVTWFFSTDIFSHMDLYILFFDYQIYYNSW